MDVVLNLVNLPALVLVIGSMIGIKKADSTGKLKKFYLWFLIALSGIASVVGAIAGQIPWKEVPLEGALLFTVAHVLYDQLLKKLFPTLTGPSSIDPVPTETVVDTTKGETK